MRQTLLRIPIDGPWSMGPWEVPGFGFGLVLALCGSSSGSCGFIATAANWRQPATLAVPVGDVDRGGDRNRVASVVRPAQSRCRHRAGGPECSPPTPDSLEALLMRAQARFSKRDYAQAVDDLKRP